MIFYVSNGHSHVNLANASIQQFFSIPESTSICQKLILPIFPVTRQTHQLVLPVLIKVYTFAKLKTCETVFGGLRMQVQVQISHHFASTRNYKQQIGFNLWHTYICYDIERLQHLISLLL